MERDILHIAIAGPAGSGKSSVARLLAQRLGLLHVDTGAMYRAITLMALEQSISLDDGDALARTLADRHLEFRDGKLQVGDRDVSRAIRSDEVTRHVSEVSAHGPVRESMVKLQRRICWAASEGAVLEGRDIGTVVFPKYKRLAREGMAKLKQLMEDDIANGQVLIPQSPTLSNDERDDAVGSALSDLPRS